MLMDWKDQYHQNDYNIQGNPQIQHNTYQIAMAFFTELELKNPEICVKIEKNLNNESNLKKENQSQRNQTP